MKKIILVGGGGHCRAVIDVIEAEGRFQVMGIVQPKADGTEPVIGYPFLGEDADLPSLLADIPRTMITVGQIKTAAVRRRLYALLKDLKVEIPVVISPTAYCSRHAQVAEGTIIMHGAVVNVAAQVGVNCIINSLALVEHDSRVGAHCHLATGCRVNGGAVIGDGSFIGSGAVVREGVKVGPDSLVGAGCVVTRDLAPGTLLKVRP